MIALLFLPAALELATLDLPRSELVDSGHAHQWTLVFREDKEMEEIVLLDQARTPPFERGSKTFGTVLARAIEEQVDDDVYVLDMLVAIDCETTQLAFVDLWEPKPQASGPKRALFNLGVFEPAWGDESGDTFRDAMFRHVCGPDWTYGPSE